VASAFLRSALRDERRILTVSRVHDGTLGIGGVAVSLPTVVGRHGATDVIEPDMNEEEMASFEHSVEVLRRASAELDAPPATHG
jgi:L-lactate dehydrogenase